MKAKGRIKQFYKDSLNMDLPTKIRHAMFLKQQNDLELEYDKRFYNRKRRNILLTLNKRIQQYQAMLLQEAIATQQELLLGTDSKSRYRYDCRFKIGFDDLHKIKGYKLLVKHGWYNRDSNISGVVKDHRFSIIDGFENNYSTNLIGHLANCELLPFTVNASKGIVSSLSIEQLREDISIWNKINKLI